MLDCQKYNIKKTKHNQKNVKNMYEICFKNRVFLGCEDGFCSVLSSPGVWGQFCTFCASGQRQLCGGKVKGFSIVNETEVDVFLEFLCFLYDPANVGSLISGSSAFSKTGLNIWKFTVHVLAEAWFGEF